MTDQASPIAGDDSQTAGQGTVVDAGTPATAPEQQTAPADGASLLTDEQGAAPEGEGEPEAPKGAPEKYEFQPADGVAVDDGVLEQFADVARSLDLTQEAAQRILDKMAPIISARQAQLVADVRQSWVDQSKADPEIGKAKLRETLSTARKALDQFGTPELMSCLRQSGIGDHPEVIRVFYRIGKAISDDSIVTGRPGAQAPAPSRDARTLYPNSNLN